MSNSFSNTLIAWYAEHGRALPWRGTRDPYLIWVSEVILQQTRIGQGREYYERFCRDYPDVRALAQASEQQVLKSWEGLGYYSRARNMCAAARQIVDEHGGVFPSTYEGLRALKGVGPYTAAAIASFAYRLPHPVIDGNVYRFVARHFGIATPVATAAAQKEFGRLLGRLIDRQRPDLFNQAIMDFGSTYCQPARHDCANCIFHDTCVARKQGNVDLLPVRAARATTRHRYFHYVCLHWLEGGREMTLVHRRDGNDIWKGLYEFPLLETAQPLSPEALRRRARKYAHELAGRQPREVRVGQPVLHQLTHQTLHATFVEAYFDGAARLSGGKEMAVACDELAAMPFPRLIARYLSLRAM